MESLSFRSGFKMANSDKRPSQLLVTTVEPASVCSCTLQAMAIQDFSIRFPAKHMATKFLNVG